jgi:hypothetical protein
MKLWKLPKIEGSVLNYGVPPLWPTYAGEKRTTFAKAYGIKVRYYWELFGEHVKNLGTLCLGTPLRSATQQGRPLHSMLQLLIGCMEILFLKLAATIFCLDL